MRRRTSTPAEPTEDVDSLVRLLRDGDGAATEIVRRRVRRIVAFRGYSIPEQDRLELEQTILTQVWRAVSRRGFESAHFWGLVEVVSSRRCIDWLRARRAETGLDPLTTPPDPLPDPLGVILLRERRELAQRVLSRLPESCRQLIELHVVLNKSYAEMEEILGKSSGALRVQMHRCVKRAHRILRRLLDA